MNPKQTPEQAAEELLKAPPPVEYETKRGRKFEFGKPALKHRSTIIRCLKVMREPAADYDAINECAKARGMTTEQFVSLKESEYTIEEKRKIMKDSTSDENLKYGEMMNEILTETLYATIKKAPFSFTTIDDFENKMDDYGEAVELFPIAIRWIAVAAMEISNTQRPN